MSLLDYYYYITFICWTISFLIPLISSNPLFHANRHVPMHHYQLVIFVQPETILFSWQHFCSSHSFPSLLICVQKYMRHHLLTVYKINMTLSNYVHFQYNAKAFLRFIIKLILILYTFSSITAHTPPFRYWFCTPFVNSYWFCTPFILKMYAFRMVFVRTLFHADCQSLQKNANRTRVEYIFGHEKTAPPGGSPKKHSL